jgi:hypothetical protein
MADPLSSDIQKNPEAGATPMFYKRPRPVDRARDGKLKVSRPKNYNFASGTNAIPLLVDEFGQAASHYPIVFAAGPSPIPAAIVGLRADQNNFIDKAGQWKTNAYLPAYVRRYPFIFMDDPNNKQFVLCIDEGSDMLGEQGEFALFKDDEPTAFTREAMEFCAMLRHQGEATDEFVKALQEQNLLKENNAQITFPNGEKTALGGFLVIDPNKFDALPDNVYLEWRKKGWIGLVFAHLLSSHRWQDLIDLGARR